MKSTVRLKLMGSYLLLVLLLGAALYTYLSITLERDMVSGIRAHLQDEARVVCEAVLALDPLWNPGGALPPHRWDGEADPDLPALVLAGEDHPGRPRTCLSNAFAFGGNNLCLVAGRP